jgi:hypothetical protein
LSEIQSFQKPKRSVAIRRDGDDFVASLMPDDHVIYRHGSAFAAQAMPAVTVGSRQRHSDGVVDFREDGF